MSGTDEWLKEDEKILGEFGECSASVGLEQAKNVGEVKSTVSGIKFGRVVVTNKRVLFFGKSGLFGMGKAREEEPGNIVTQFDTWADPKHRSNAFIPNMKGFQMYFDVSYIRKVVSGSRPADGKAKVGYGSVPVTILTGVGLTMKGFIGKQEVGINFSHFLPQQMEAIKKEEHRKEDLSKKTGLFAGMEKGLLKLDVRGKIKPFSDFILFVNFGNKDTMDKFIQLLSDKCSAAADYKSNDALVRKDYFHE